MADTPTRGRRSKIDLLPEHIRKELDAMLRDGRLNQTDILDAINDLIAASQLPEELKLSRSGLNRYATQVEAVGASIRELREATTALTAQLGDKPTGETTKVILELARSQLFKAFLRQSNDPEAEIDIGMIKDAMLAAQRLEATAATAHKREKEIRQAFAEEAAAAAETVAKQAGLTADAVTAIRNQILGIA